MGGLQKTNAEIRKWYLEEVALIHESIEWKRTADPRHPFAAKFDGEKCVIRLNDFPDEHLYALIVDGEEVIAFDDWSATWNRPAKEKAASQTAPNKSPA